MKAEVREHPQGGWTIAAPVPGTAARIYVGNWPTRRLAEIALAEKQSMFERVLQLADTLSEVTP